MVMRGNCIFNTMQNEMVPYFWQSFLALLSRVYLHPVLDFLISFSSCFQCILHIEPRHSIVYPNFPSLKSCKVIKMLYVGVNAFVILYASRDEQAPYLFSPHEM